jgi:type I restriction enzyme S subunit
LEKIKAEKLKLIKEGKIKQGKPLPEIKPDEIPFEIPSSWKWVRLGEISKIQTGRKDADEGNISGKYSFYTCAILPIKSDSYSFEGESLLFPGNGANVGFMRYVNECFEAYQRTYVVNEIQKISVKYLYYIISTRWKKALGQQYGSAINYIKINNLTDYMVPIAPINEQKNIVKKIEELMKLCDEIDQRGISLEDKLKELKSAILQSAIQGKLVPQDLNDEPASVLLEKIQKEKLKLIKEGKIKKEKPLPEIKPEEIPFKIPSSWKWVRMGEIGYTSVGLTYSPKDISSDGIPVIRSSNIQNDKIYWGDLVRVSKDIPEKLILKNGDIVICARNGSHRLVGKSVQMKDMQEKVTFGAFMAYYRSICNDYVIYFINSKQFRKVLGDVNTTTINQITQNSLKEAILPLPPFREQKRIVKKLQGIMNYIDGCNLKLNQMKELSTKINETVLN